MIPITIFILVAVALGLAHVSAVADDRWLLVAAGGFLLITGSMIAMTGIQLQDGYDIDQTTFENSNNETITNTTKTAVYRDLNQDYDSPIEEFIMALFFGSGLFAIMRGSIGRGGRVFNR